MPGHVTFEGVDGATRMTVVSQFVDVAQLQKRIDVRTQESMAQAISQVDCVLAAASI